jgi:hypothetical protein
MQPNNNHVPQCSEYKWSADTLLEAGAIGRAALAVHIFRLKAEIMGSNPD